MSSKVKYKQGTEHFEPHELLELGRRLDESQLETMGLLAAVMEQEKQAYWRLSAAAELLGPLAQSYAPDLSDAAHDAARQVAKPARGSAKQKGQRAQAGKRTFPEPGTLIVKQHRYQSYNVPTVTKNGKTTRSPFRTFRFVVVGHPSTLLLLGDDEDRLFRNPSLAASAATGNENEPGWDFFGLGYGG